MSRKFLLASENITVGGETPLGKTVYIGSGLNTHRMATTEVDRMGNRKTGS